MSRALTAFLPAKLQLYLHLCVWSQIGVLARITLGRVLGSGCSSPGEWSWVPCVTSDGFNKPGGALFTDIFANILGCFGIGILATSDVLSDVLHVHFTKCNLAAVPSTSWAQSHLPLQVGLRTGFCGSLTTFASWELQMVVMAVGGSKARMGMQWVESISGLLLGTLCSLSALVLGQHAAAALRHRHEASEGPSPKQEVPLQPIPQQNLPTHVLATSQTAAQQEPTEQQAMEIEETEPPTPSYTQDELLTDITVLAAGIAITAGCIIGAAQGSSSPYQFMWISLLLGPPGCILRYQLARWNYQLAGHLSWVPAGTFAANMLACLVDYVAKLLLHKLPGLGQPGSSLLQALVTGFGGALSTVSTWVLEVQQLLRGFPSNSRAYSYYLSTMASAYLLGLLVYGTAVWVG